MDLDRVLCRTRTRDGGGAKTAHHPDCAGYGWPRRGANPHAWNYLFEFTRLRAHSPDAFAITLLGSAANSGPRSLRLMLDSGRTPGLCRWRSLVSSSTLRLRVLPRAVE